MSVCAFQNISMHMVHHVVDGIKLHGPVHSMWMYVYERFNSWVCKRVTNRSQPETTVMQTYKVRQDLCYYRNLYFNIQYFIEFTVVGGSL